MSKLDVSLSGNTATSVFLNHTGLINAVPSGLLAAGVFDEAVGLELAEDAVDGGLGEMGPFHDFDG